MEGGEGGMEGKIMEKGSIDWEGMDVLGVIYCEGGDMMKRSIIVVVVVVTYGPSS